MSNEYQWGVTSIRPSRRLAQAMHRICREEGGYGFTEVNLQYGEAPGINNGCYQAWFSGPNYGAPFDGSLAACVAARIEQWKDSHKRPRRRPRRWYGSD